MRFYQIIACLLTVLVCARGEVTEAERQEALNMQAAFAEAHKNDPQDPMELAQKTLSKSFALNNDGESSLSAAEVMKRISKTHGESRLHLIRIFELMDSNHDGKTSSQEFVAFYQAPVAYADKGMAMMFRLYDYDANGFITIWEALRAMLAVQGLNNNILDAYKMAQTKIKDMDVDNDGKVDEAEFLLFISYQITVGMYYEKQAQDAARKRK